MVALISSTASGLTGAVGKLAAVDTAVGGAYTACPTTSSSTVSSCPQAPQLSITPESQTSFSNSAWPRSATVPERSGPTSQRMHDRHGAGSREIVSRLSGIRAVSPTHRSFLLPVFQDRRIA